MKSNNVKIRSFFFYKISLHQPFISVLSSRTIIGQEIGKKENRWVCESWLFADHVRKPGQIRKSLSTRLIKYGQDRDKMHAWKQCPNQLFALIRRLFRWRLISMIRSTTSGDGSPRKKKTREKNEPERTEAVSQWLSTQLNQRIARVMLADQRPLDPSWWIESEGIWTGIETIE